MTPDKSQYPDVSTWDEYIITSRGKAPDGYVKDRILASGDIQYRRVSEPAHGPKFFDADLYTGDLVEDIKPYVAGRGARVELAGSDKVVSGQEYLDRHGETISESEKQDKVDLDDPISDPIFEIPGIDIGQSIDRVSEARAVSEHIGPNRGIQPGWMSDGLDDKLRSRGWERDQHRGWMEPEIQGRRVSGSYQANGSLAWDFPPRELADAIGDDIGNILIGQKYFSKRGYSIPSEYQGDKFVPLSAALGQSSDSSPTREVSVSRAIQIAQDAGQKGIIDSLEGLKVGQGGIPVKDGKVLKVPGGLEKKREKDKQKEEGGKNEKGGVNGPPLHDIGKGDPEGSNDGGMAKGVSAKSLGIAGSIALIGYSAIRSIGEE